MNYVREVVRVRRHDTEREQGNERGCSGQFTRSMDYNNDLLRQIRAEWPRRGRAPEALVATQEFKKRHPELPLQGIGDLDELVRTLEPRAGRPILERAALVQALLQDAADPLLHRALLQTMLPGVVSVCRQLHFGRGVVDEPRELMDETISMASELIVDWAGQSRLYAAPDLVSALRSRMRRWLLKEKAARSNIPVEYVAEIATSKSTTLLTRLSGHCGGPNDRLARLTYARVFEGRALKELALSDRSAPRALQSELQQFATRFLL